MSWLLQQALHSTQMTACCGDRDTRRRRSASPLHRSKNDTRLRLSLHPPLKRTSLVTALEPTRGLRLHAARPFSNNSRRNCVVKFVQRPKVEIKRHGPRGRATNHNPSNRRVPTGLKVVSNSQQALWDSLCLQKHSPSTVRAPRARPPFHPLCPSPPRVPVTCSPGQEKNKEDRLSDTCWTSAFVLVMKDEATFSNSLFFSLRLLPQRTFQRAPRLCWVSAGGREMKEEMLRVKTQKMYGEGSGQI